MKRTTAKINTSLMQTDVRLHDPGNILKFYEVHAPGTGSERLHSSIFEVSGNSNTGPMFSTKSTLLTGGYNTHFGRLARGSC
jgi:hypothetical protein